jgi:hypothetical protein
MWRLYETGIGLTTEFTGSQYSYSVLHFTTQYCSLNSELITGSKLASSSLLLAFASMVILGVEPHRDP